MIQELLTSADFQQRKLELLFKLQDSNQSTLKPEKSSTLNLAGLASPSDYGKSKKNKLKRTKTRNIKKKTESPQASNKSIISESDSINNPDDNHMSDHTFAKKVPKRKKSS